jgi:uncharacterized delta-60 repeat protein
MKKALTLLAFLSLSSFIFSQTSGTLDATFGTNGRITSTGVSQNYGGDIIIQPDGKIVISVASFRSGFDTSFTQLVRYNTNGTLDNTFGIGGKVKIVIGSFFCAQWLALQSDGKIIAVSANIVARFKSDGTLDSTFNRNGFVKTQYVANKEAGAGPIALQADGKIVVGGAVTIDATIGSGNVLIARYNSNGSLDSTFSNKGVSVLSLATDKQQEISSIAVQSDNKILACGYVIVSQSPTWLMDLGLVRYMTNGTLDASFGTNGIMKVANIYPVSVKSLNNGKILVAGGGFGSDAGLFILYRFNTNGSLDATFGTNGKITTAFGTQAQSFVNDMLIQKDGKIVLLGGSDLNSSNPVVAVARYSSEGILDNAFGTSGKASIPAILPEERYGKLAIQSDGKLVAVGSLITRSTITANYMVIRLNNTVNVGVKSIENTPLSIYPNPMTTALTIDFKTPINKAIKLTISDMMGRIVYQKAYDFISSKISLNIDNLNAGLYVVNFVFDGENISRVVAKN